MKWISFFGVMALLLATMAVAPLPPSFEYQQLHGTVAWDAELLVTPQNVIAKTPSSEFRSFIRHDSCLSTAVECTGTYGKETSNFLRVHAAAGQSIQLFVDSRLVMAIPYQPDQVSELLLNISSPKVVSPPATPTTNTDPEEVSASSSNMPSPNASANALACVSDWKCGGWSTCAGGQQSRSCVDAQQCSAAGLTKEETQACTSGTPASLPPSGQQGATIPVQQPSPSPLPAETCSDGLKNQDEERIDCGGVCASCIKPTEPAEISLWWYIMGIIVLLALIGSGIFYALRLRHVSVSPIQDQQLLRYFQTNFARGLNKSQITETLVRSGWNKGVIRSFLRKRKL